MKRKAIFATDEFEGSPVKADRRKLRDLRAREESKYARMMRDEWEAELLERFQQ